MAQLGSFEATRFALGRRNFNTFEINGSKGSVAFNFERMNELEYYNNEDPDDRQGFRTINVNEGSQPYSGVYWPPGHIIGYEHTFINTVYDLLNGHAKAKARTRTSVRARNATPCSTRLKKHPHLNSGKTCRSYKNRKLGFEYSNPSFQLEDSMKIYLNGQLVDKADAKISVFDHGFLYGDGVFEGCRVYNGRIFRLDAHLERLARSSRAILLEWPVSREEYKQAIIETVRANNMRDGYIRAIISRGAGDLGLDPRKCPVATTVIIADAIKLYPPEVYEQGMECVTASTRRSRPDVLSPAIKSLNYLNHIMAKIECIRAGVPNASC
jgi:hypothetical protein